MTGQAATLANFLGTQKSDQGPILFHFQSPQQRFIVALPADQLVTLITGAIAQLPLAVDARGIPAASQVMAVPVTRAASFHQDDGSLVLGLTIPSGGQIAFQLSSELRETVTRLLVDAQSELSKPEAERRKPPKLVSPGAALGATTAFMAAMLDIPLGSIDLRPDGQKVMASLQRGEGREPLIQIAKDAQSRAMQPVDENKCADWADQMIQAFHVDD